MFFLGIKALNNDYEKNNLYSGICTGMQRITL